MPELPEVETLRRQLEQIIIGRPLIATQTFDDKLPDLSERVGRRIVAVNRRGKNLLLSFDDGRTLAVHLRMTGRLLWEEEECTPSKYTRLVMMFPHGRIFFVDPRRFMTLVWERTFPEFCGPDPLQNLRLSYLADRGKKRKGPIKSFLLDQSVIAGIGNIYACEILYMAGIAPDRPTCSLNTKDWRRLFSAIKAILNKAVACHGTSISDWRDFTGHKGSFQHELRVYNRKGLPCLRCGQTVLRITLGGRGTYFCPGCQI
ncbi:MAG: bifunctional DNA-formamidopyrimidine glycosylase/DNA-(apurinic or apyrimidinic site) lyase [Syntrophaceae bacterium]|nr:bifunctional DNA-formamidopyrimidine glycosylase/DNA-(apurinic or apyrimidinic site) lyase [Syntrophaceae bacterium]